MCDHIEQSIDRAIERGARQPQGVCGGLQALAPIGLSLVVTSER